MSKNEQVLILEPPSELQFIVSDIDEQNVSVKSSYLKLTNPTDREIFYKVKTTAPKTYCVRPNNGVIQPKKTVVVAVMLQPPLENVENCKHKFMVQSMFAPDGDFSAETLWRDTPPEGLMNSKLKCVFIREAPEAASEPQTVETEVAAVQHYTPKINSDIRKMEKDVEKLKEELNQLRLENSALKEEGLRTRMSYDARTRGVLAKPADTDHRNKYDKQQELLFSNTFICLSVMIFLIGLVLGMYIL